MSLEASFGVLQALFAIVLVFVILLQTKGSSMGGIFGGETSSVYRTRRGFERRLFQFTIGLAVAFFILALINSLIMQPA